MKEKLKQIREKLEIEKSNSKKFLLSNLYYSLIQELSNEEQKQEEKKEKGIEFLLKDYEIYDFLRNDNEIYKEFYTKTNKKFKENKFHSYELYPENKINRKEAKDIVYEILDDINIDNIKSYDRLYCYNKVKSEEQDICIGKCYNTFGFTDPIIITDSNIKDQVTYIKTLVHELGHEYENIFMSNMSVEQQVDRYDYCFTEVMSSLFERIAQDYLIKHNIYKDDAQRDLNLNYFDLHDRLGTLYELSNEALEGKLIYNAGNVIEFSELPSKDGKKMYQVYNYNYINDIKYSYGYLLAEYFFDIYRQDKKEGLKQIRNFLANQVLFDERQMLESINFKESNYSFLNQGLTENMTYMRKKYKW